MEWHYETPSGRKGPVTIENLKKLFIDGQIDHNTLVWKPGMQDWVPIVQCIDIFDTTKPKAGTLRRPSAVKADKSSDFVVGVLCWLAALSLIVGVILCAVNWPEYSRYSGKREPIEFALSFVWLISGIVEAVMFVIFAHILVYLNKIEINTRKD